MQSLAVLNVVGLTQALIGRHTPFISSWQKQQQTAYITGNVPAVTTTSQSNYLTGQWPKEHGIVGNGWYDRRAAEIQFWKQSNKLVGAPKVWDVAKSKNKAFTCANMFWWYNMYSTADYSVTPRPLYFADGLKMPDCYAWPYHLRHDLQEKFGTFPLFKFWGPMTSIASTQWIADASMEVYKRYSPTLNLVYLPHLDYSLQKIGPDPEGIAKDLNEIDAICQTLIEFYESQGVKVALISEYGITKVDTPIYLNRIFRSQNWLAIKEDVGREYLDAGHSQAFAVADHQIAHIYIKDDTLKPDVLALLRTVEGIADIIDPVASPEHPLAHANAGDLIVIASPNAWFAYYYWNDDKKAPDFAPTVDIHRKPGYDPVELFMNPGIGPKLNVVKTLIKKKLGFRYLMDVIPLNAHLVKGSHGAPVENLAQGPLLIGDLALEKSQETMPATDVFNWMLMRLELH